MPVRPLRAGMLAYIAALAAIEVVVGVVVAFAYYEQNTRVSVDQAELQRLAELFSRLRIIEAVVAAGAVITTVLWSFTVVRNASAACRNGRSGAAAVVSWALVPVLVFVLADIRSEATPRTVSVSVLVAQAAVMYLPFGTIAVASRRVGGTTMPFVRWYIALTSTFIVHEAFTGSFNLADKKPSDDLGRAAALMIASALVLGLMVIMAGEASQSMESATERRLETHRSWRDEALRRFRAVASAERDNPRPLPTQLVGTRQNVLVAAGNLVPMHAPPLVIPNVLSQTAAPIVPASHLLPAPHFAEPSAEVLAALQRVVTLAPLAPAPQVAVTQAPAPQVEAPAPPAVMPGFQALAPRPQVQAPQVVTPAPEATVAAPTEVEEPPPAPAPAAGGMFAPLAPRTTPRSL
ncbi:MAG: hypothetical protein Q7V57_17795 [Actinomycetota bacterium]|nr:hypothetical protein [Actinomycetota bacterium]